MDSLFAKTKALCAALSESWQLADKRLSALEDRITKLEAGR